MKRSELKAIIKECIMEIFAEKFGMESIVQTIAEKPRDHQRRDHQSRNQKQLHNPVLDSIRNIIPESSAGKDVMSSIFADTATTTLVEQGKGDGRRAVVDTGVDPTLFEGSKNWAALAFSDALEKK